jgi:hypothetical protein
MLPLVANPLPPPFGLVLLALANTRPRTFLTRHYYSDAQMVRSHATFEYMCRFFRNDFKHICCPKTTLNHSQLVLFFFFPSAPFNLIFIKSFPFLSTPTK